MPGQVRVNSGTLSGGSSGLGTDPFPLCVQTAAHSGLGTGIFCAVVLVAGAIALAAYSYFRLKQRTTGFQRFEVRERGREEGRGKGGKRGRGVQTEKGMVGLPFVCFCACEDSPCL